ncbi:MAG: Ubiquitin- modifier 1 [Sclerophora amabilis]|nr:MAG: Ubiquitin- modifier 1 [Sclerophora amabilis]
MATTEPLTDPPPAAPEESPENEPSISITVEFTGGLEMLFSDQRKHHLSIPAVDRESSSGNDDTPPPPPPPPANIAFLVRYLCRHVMRDRRQELFVLDGTVRPGILVLINDADWELEGEEKYELQQGDNILFVSTLHGG